jgi:hypothetical protein
MKKKQKILQYLNFLYEIFQIFKTKIEKITKQVDSEYFNPCFEELWYLRVTFFSSMLSLFLLSGIDQTLEIYRVYALNISNPLAFLRILISFISVCLLSFLVWYSGRRLSKKRCIDKHDLKAKYENLSKEIPVRLWTRIFRIRDNICIGIKYLTSGKNYNEDPLFLTIIHSNSDIKSQAIHSRAEALRWLPRILGFVPLLALAFGLFRSINISGSWGLFPSIIFLPSFVLVIVALSYYSIPFRFLFAAISSIFALGLISKSNNISVFHLLNSNNIISVFCLCLGIVTVILLSTFYFDIVNNRERKVTGNMPKKNIELNKKTPAKGIQKISSYASEKFVDDNQLFGESFLVLLISLSIITFAIFTFPLVIWENSPRFLAVSFIGFVLFLLFLKLKWKRSLKTFLFIFAILFLILTALVPIASYLGSVCIIALSLSVFVSWTSAIFYYEYISKIPLIAILLLLAIISSSFNWNDNHKLREISQKYDCQINNPEKCKVNNLEKSFEAWKNSPLRSEKISKATEDHPYPIYVISAQGGGIFAAYHAALTLSRVQDLSPNFASHIFAISGVSGGSLGSAVFSSLVKAQNLPPCDKPKDKGHELECNADKILSQDLLSPLLSAGLFPDFVQRFLPLPIYPVDRARGLEYAFEQAWDIMQPDEQPDKNPLRNSYYKHWNSNEAAPALVLNTTVVETGEPLLISPFTFSSDSDSKKFPILADIYTVACPNIGGNHLNFPLSTAAVLSARFPLVTPVGWFETCKHKNEDSKDKNGASKDKSENKNEDIIKSKSQLADGGYFENSGFSTAYEIGKRIQEFKGIHEAKKIKEDKRFKVVYLAITDGSISRSKQGGLNEILSPFLAFYNSGNARGRSAVERAEYEIDHVENKETEDLSEHKFRQFYLTHYKEKGLLKPCDRDSDLTTCDKLPKDNSGFNLPLGWYFSGFSQDYIKARIGNYEYCEKHGSEPAYNNHCVLKTILDELKYL